MTFLNVILSEAKDLPSACAQILRFAQDDNARRMTENSDLDWEES